MATTLTVQVDIAPLAAKPALLGSAAIAPP
jgi:hypothetical protein